MGSDPGDSSNGNGVIPGTYEPKDPHVHQFPKKKGPIRKFGLDGKPLDGGANMPRKDKSAFQKAVRDAMKYLPKVRLPPLMITPSWIFLDSDEA